MRLKDKRIIVSGGASGIGLAIVNRFLKNGAQIVLFDNNTKAGYKVQEKYGKQGKTVKFIPTDVCSEKNVESSIKDALAYLGSVDVLVNNVGAMQTGGILETTVEQWDFILRVNLRSLFHICQKIVPFFLRQGHGNIINMASVFGVKGVSGFLGYSTAKSGVIGFTQALAGELMRSGIRVNSISPGIILTPLLTKIHFLNELSNKPMVIKDSLQTVAPLTGTLGEPDDVAGVALFLASDDAKWITGTNIVVDGGFSQVSAWTKIRDNLEQE